MSATASATPRAHPRRARLLLVSLAAAALAAAATSASAATPEERGRAIAEQVYEAQRGFDGERADLRLDVVDALGERTTHRLQRRAIELVGRAERSIVEVVAGPHAGTRVLTFSHRRGEDDQWLYGHRENRVTRVQGAARFDGLAESELSYEDLSPAAPEKFTHRLLDELVVGGQRIFRLHRTPAARHSAYGAQIVWVDAKRLVVLRVDSFDRRAALLRTASYTDHQRTGRWLRPRRVRIFNHQTNRRSLLVYERLDLEKSFPLEDFDKMVLAQWLLENAVR